MRVRGMLDDVAVRVHEYPIRMADRAELFRSRIHAMRGLASLVLLGCGSGSPDTDSSGDGGGTIAATTTDVTGSDGSTAGDGPAESTGATCGGSPCGPGQVCAAGQCVTPDGDCPDPGCPEICRDGICVDMASECIDPGCGIGEVCIDPMNGMNPRCEPCDEPEQCG